MAHHEFTPTHYHTTIGWHEPVLAIAPRRYGFYHDR